MSIIKAILFFITSTASFLLLLYIIQVEMRRRSHKFPQNCSFRCFIEQLLHSISIEAGCQCEYSIVFLCEISSFILSHFLFLEQIRLVPHNTYYCFSRACLLDLCDPIRFEFCECFSSCDIVDENDDDGVAVENLIK